MGAFYGGIHIRTDDRDSVVAALKGLAKRKRRFFVSPVSDGWVSVFPNLNGQDDKVSKAVAKRLDANILHLAIHDDDVLYYWFYQGGKLIDKFSSCPDYFGEITGRAKARWQGKPELLEGEDADYIVTTFQMDLPLVQIVHSRSNGKAINVFKNPNGKYNKDLE